MLTIKPLMRLQWMEEIELQIKHQEHSTSQLSRLDIELIFSLIIAIWAI